MCVFEFKYCCSRNLCDLIILESVTVSIRTTNIFKGMKQMAVKCYTITWKSFRINLEIFLNFF